MCAPGGGKEGGGCEVGGAPGGAMPAMGCEVFVGPVAPAEDIGGIACGGCPNPGGGRFIGGAPGGGAPAEMRSTWKVKIINIWDNMIAV